MSVRLLSLARAWRDQSGAMAAEFAMVLPAFIIMVLGVLEFGRAQHEAATMRYALESASRKLMLNPSLNQEQVQTLVRSQSASPQEITVTLQISTATGSRVAYLTGRYAHTIEVPLLNRFPIAYESTVAAALPAL